jgi:hypothetical protein
MKTGIVGILNNPATSMNSHSAGMNKIVASLFNANLLSHVDNWEEYDQLIIYHGPNFKEGSYNVIGGITIEVLIRAKKLSQFKGIIKTLDGFQLNDFSIKRKINLYNDFTIIEKIELPFMENMVIGDSHSLSVWPNENYGISRNDGKTLFGFLKLEKDLSLHSHVILYFGNIDIRFHLCRQLDPINATKELFTRYVEYAKKYNCTLVELLPIEDESRKLPASGLYKGKPFYGSIDQRKQIREIANEIIRNSGLDYLSWPDEFLDEKGNLKFDVMEPKQSVHLRPSYYLKNFKKQLNLF